MLVSQKHGFVFFCMPKCASNSIERMLKPYCEIHLTGTPRVRHTNVRNFRQFIQPYLSHVGGVEELESICLVREPISWLNSWYRFRARYELRSERRPYSTAHISFEDFIRSYLARPRPAYAEIGTQYDFVRDVDGRCGVDRLFAYDDIDEVVAFFSTRLERHLSIRALNVSPEKIYGWQIVERMDALKRRLFHLMPVSRQKKATATKAWELPPDLCAAVRLAIPKDFELYEELT